MERRGPDQASAGGGAIQVGSRIWHGHAEVRVGSGDEKVRSMNEKVGSRSGKLWSPNEKVRFWNEKGGFWNAKGLNRNSASLKAWMFLVIRRALSPIVPIFLRRNDAVAPAKCVVIQNPL